MGNGMSRVGCRNLLAGVVQKSMCFSIFFCGCKLLKSFHIVISGTKIALFLQETMLYAKINVTRRLF